jgi:hypothetical protein
MSRQLSSLIALFVMALSMSGVRSAMAQEDEPKDKAEEEKEKEKSTDSESAEEESAEEAPKKKAKASDDESTPVQAEADPNSPVEEPGKTYHFLGLRYRAIIVPKFMINLFGEGGRTVVVHSFGPEAGIRKDGFEYDFGLWFANYAMEDTPFKAKNDPDVSWELVKSELKVLYLTADFLWSHELSPQFAINYGLGAGFGIVWGNLFRVQAFPPSADAIDDPYQWQRCISHTDPRDTLGDYCEIPDDNEHFDNFQESSWANGGSKPVLFPWLALQTGVRFKPHRNFAARVDLGFGTSGFFVGVGADYGL